MNRIDIGKHKYYKNFYMNDEPSIHTVEFDIRITRKTFMDIYCKSYAFMKSVNKFDGTRFCDFDHYFPCVKSMLKRKYGKFPFINLATGLRVKFSIGGEYGHIKIFVDPILFMAGRSKQFNSSEYNYLQISSRDFNFWANFVKEFKNFLLKWKIPESIIDTMKPSRVDFCANIYIDKKFPIKKFFKYIRIMPKYFRFSDKNKSIGIFDECQYSEEDLKRKSKYENMVKFGNSNHSITLYDKIVEQSNVFGRSYPGIYLIRIEYQPEHGKIEDVINKLYRSGYLGNDFRLWFDPRCYGVKLLYSLYVLSQIAPYAILMAITEFLPTEIIRSKEKTYLRISKIKCNDDTKNLMYKFVDILSTNLSHDDMRNSIKEFKTDYGDYRYYKIMHLLHENNIAPVYLDDLDVTPNYHSYPSIRDMYLSAVQNACNERNMN